MSMNPDPRPSGLTGFLTLIEREYYRFARLAAQTIAPPVIMTGLFVVIFGYSLGGRIESISGVSYILYILPGLAGMGAITNSYSNSSTSLYMARIDRSIENILVAPLTPLKIVAAFVIGGVTRGLVVGTVTVAVAVLLTDLTIGHMGWGLLVLTLISAIFSSLGVISALWAEDWDHLATFSNFVITPFVYLGGVFYSVTMLPGVWKKVSYANPMFYFIDAFRWAVLGRGDLCPWLSIGVTVFFAFGLLSVAVLLFRSGYKLVV
ncbi:MAG TPA: ABC transporter permease [bacterium]|nr:ABC transporter permease [bacterium]